MNKEVSFYNLTDEETIKKMIGELIKCNEFCLKNIKYKEKSVSFFDCFTVGFCSCLR